MSLNSGKLVLLSPLGFSPTGQAFNLSFEDVAAATAAALKADKLMFLTPFPGLQDEEGHLVTELSIAQLQDYLQLYPDLPSNMRNS